MNRMNFSLPEFTRIVWAPGQDKIWGPRVQAINQAWPQIERLTVDKGMRVGALQSVYPSDLMSFQDNCLKIGVPYIILARDGEASVYGNATTPYEDGKPWRYRVYMGGDSKLFLDKWRAQDNVEIGRYLGYPLCCSKFFQAYWKIEGWRDLTPLMGSECSYLCNILLRHLGVRSVFHLPCSFSCPETQGLGQRILKAGYEAGFEQETEWIHEMLRWPIEWSSLHGVAIITTPFVKIVTSTDALAERIEIKLNQGITSTFIDPTKLVDTWTDNGFRSRGEMNHAHNFILKIVREIKLLPGKVIDLGCGNALLLKKIEIQDNNLVGFGVENGIKGYRKGPTIFHADIYDFGHWKDEYSLTLISIQRLIEEPIAAIQLLVNISKWSKTLIIYSYNKEWTHDFDALIGQLFDVVVSNLNLSQDYQALALRSK